MKLILHRLLWVVALCGLSSISLAGDEPKIENWREHVASADVEQLLPEVIRYLKHDYPNNAGKLLAVRLGAYKDNPYKTDKLGRPLSYNLMIQVAYKTDDVSGHALVVQGKCPTAGDVKAPPFEYCNQPSDLSLETIKKKGFFYWFVPLDQIPDQTQYGIGSSGEGGVLGLLLATALLVCGLLLAAPVVQAKLPQLGFVYEKLLPKRGVFGVAMLAIGVLVLLVNLLSPWQDLLPVVAALLGGLVLGIEILVRKPARSMADSIGGLEATNGTVAKVQVKTGDTAVKAAAAADAAIDKVQQVLIKNQEKIRKLEAFQVPIGYACLALGILHLMMGSVVFL